MIRHEPTEGFTALIPDGHELVVVDDGALESAWFSFDGDLVAGLDAHGVPDGTVFGPTAIVDDLVGASGDVSPHDIAIADRVEFDLDGRLWMPFDESSSGALRGLRFEIDGARPLLVHGTPLDALSEQLATARVRWSHLVDAIGTATAGSAIVAASEILLVDWWNSATAAALVELAEAADAWGSDPDDPVPGVEVSLAAIDTALFRSVEAAVGDHVVPRLRGHWPEFAWCGLHDAFVIRYDPSDGNGELRLHHDVAQISASMRLVDGYEGGALEFPRQVWDNSDVPVGTLVVWPSLVTHPHRGAPVERGRKYGLTLWFRLPD